ncbi:uncharacterized protein N7515_009633 [Penicillium bovifimosum]|uniref:chitinase n=1 Tax=Penicillium bovifimosum TaxID=126998 RepID=A0A9W9KVQ6_9EURO|nr:uncharacterized protein N7515_009633 [Penicillium bovifimosum]KAJ5121672.1 hypothetical protein N7515_009633 [Penicillium bovifimosum]
MPSTAQLLVALALSSGISAKPDQKAWEIAYSNCPIECAPSTNPTPGQWSAYRGFEDLAFCNETMLLGFSLYNESPSVSVHACQITTDAQESIKVSSKVADTSYSDEEIKFEVGWWGNATLKISEGTNQALNELKASVLNSQKTSSKAEFAYSDGSLAGIFVGSDIESSDVSINALQNFIEDLNKNPIPGQILFQYCGIDSGRGLGLVIDTTGNFTGVRQIMRGWDESTCAGGFDGRRNLSQSVKIRKLPQISSSTSASNETHQHSRRHHGNHLRHESLHRRSTCKTTQAKGGDTCSGLATKCGISLTEFYNYNTDKSRCSPLIVGSYFCCGAGDLPDLSPKPNDDGTCASYTIQTDDSCSKLAAANDITAKEIEKYNENTWGWTGCGILQAKLNICLSSGDPPMPSIYGNAVCGPQVNGTTRPTDGTDLADLNPCPLNACCDVWGQCGITSDFCTKTNSTTGAPGTAKNGTNGCISNCGTDIVNNDDAPSDFLSVGYFEAFDQQRECLNMDITNFDTGSYSHLHFAFASITTDYDINVTTVQGQFDKLKTLSGTKRILSFGGWSFSTDADSFPIFRKGVTDANRELFATNAANFIEDNDLDGIDFDWEYPGAPDIPGIPAGDEGDGDRYLEFLKLVRKNLPDDKSLSLAVPASFWYLKGFPIANISDTVNYIVFMSYDLHGQWDYGNQYPDPGCKSGACLRSHVNLTETTSALSMITKAGVPGSKVVGMASYGRSFEMAEAGCTGPNCKYTGPDSGATPGRCTNTAGYIANAELNEIIDTNDSPEKSFDKGSDSNILVYNKTQWVTYMDDTTKETQQFCTAKRDDLGWETLSRVKINANHFR